MAYVIGSACIDVKDGACVKCCPVDCIYVGGRTLYIHPDECIDCGICVSACPVEAIYEDLRSCRPKWHISRPSTASSSRRTSAGWARPAARPTPGA
jgi:NAD-dependent dihydropyrimidine dehydrogenase PreA subunit